MGATTFESYALGKTAGEAFREARERAQYDHGHSGYSGTIAEKHDFVLVEIPKGVRCSTDRFLRLLDEVSMFQDIEYMRSTIQYERTATAKRKREAEIRKEGKRQDAFWRKQIRLEAVLRKAAPIFDDKWGPALALEVKGQDAVEYKKRAGRAGTHDKVFLFCGYASC